MIIFIEVEAHDQDFQSFDAQLDSGSCFMCPSVPVGFQRIVVHNYI